ncbi:MAG: SMP-30/gluconolactonase/LRE family protein [Paracraurococcus sp.]
MHPTSRRGLLAGAGALTGALAAAPAFAAWQPAERYPDPRIQELDPAFARYRLFNAAVEQIWAGDSRWNEGPVWFGDARSLIWSDIPNNRMLRWSETTGRVDEFRKPSGQSNGNTRDRQGRLVTCEHAGRRVSRTEWDGRVITLCDSYQGKRLNSPNDVVVKSDGSIWFTDPPFGILGEYEGDRATPELPTNVYRIDGQSGAVSVVTGDINRPNGLAFSPDESRLYIVESGVAPRVIHVFDVVENGTKLARGRVFHQCKPGETPDGFRVDIDGNLWCGWGTGEGLDGVRVLDPEGKPIGFIALPDRCPNLAFGGRKRNRLFMLTGRAVYSLYVGATGAA